MVQRRPPTVTMHQVAAAAGVSQATVSLVLNRSGGSRVAESTRRRVLDAVDELGYRPNAAAKTLRDGTAGLIGFVGDVVASSPFAGRIVEGAQARAWDDGMLLLTVNTGGDPRIEAAAIDSLLSHRVAGIVYASMYHRKLHVPESLADVPTVVLNSEDASGRARAVVPDERGGGRQAAEALLDAGHRRIAMINIETLASGLPAAVERYEGYRRALEDAGAAVEPELVRESDGNPQAGYDHTLALMSLAAPPTAIFCANDRTAWGAYQALESLGLRVPDDVSIVGFDNQETLAPFLRPALTTLELPFVAMGRRAVDILLDDVVQADGPERIGCPIITRDSVAAPRGAHRG
ncbi:LacI family DNA-binding transcriptional regulator [Agromyces albus]|uniref:LacI family DNA-binding transcriptional regulator n=1 Tax=Agromyces albus TaxID=205332 RepID=UPI0027870B77|nr:LacI family DNA-binding transcriptional regulator [Agromyces albus]MDQ0576639.1 LacI family transcriptional regulator [Agromyces albus]